MRSVIKAICTAGPPVSVAVADKNVYAGQGATLVALAWTLPDRSPRALARLGLEALGGGAIAVALVSALTLAVGGGLPHFGMLFEFPRIFGTEGFGLLPMPSVGFHLVVYATFVAAIAVAAVRGLAGDDRLLSVALAWVGIFGLGVGAYFTGRSHPHVLIDIFTVWSYALVLLAIVAIRSILRRPGRRRGGRPGASPPSGGAPPGKSRSPTCCRA